MMRIISEKICWINYLINNIIIQFNIISDKKLIISKSYTKLVTRKIKNKDNKGCNTSGNILLCNRLDFP